MPAPTAPPATAAPGETLPPTTTQPAATTTTTPLASLPPCPVDALDGATAPVEVTFWHGLGGESEDALVALTDAYNASQQRVRIRLENQGGYKQTIDKYTQSSQSGPAGHGHVPGVHGAAGGRLRQRRPGAGVLRGERLRHVAVPPQGAAHVRDRGRAVVDAVQRQQPGALLPEADCSWRPASTRRTRPSQSSSCARRRRRSSTRARRRRASPSTRASTPAAAGSSSSGSPACTSRTPTTATAGWRRRRRCSTPAPSASS